MICPQCQHENPENNRFCGDCGAALRVSPAAEKDSTPSSDTPSVSPASSSHYDPEGYDDEGGPKLSPEVIEYDKQIPIIAEPGSDRRSHVPKHIMDEVHDFLDDIHKPVNGTPIDETRPDARELHEDANARTHVRADAGLAASQADTRRSSYLDLEDSRDAREPQTDRVSGPSFLGLGNSDYEYVYDDQRPSHWRRNFALLILLVLAGLAAVQWRSIRDIGLEYAKSGSMKIRVPKPGEQAQTANANQQANGANNTGNGTPNMSVDATRNADAENAKLKTEEEAAKGQQTAQQNNSGGPANTNQPNTASTTPPPVPPADTATSDNVSNTRAANSTSADNAAASNPRVNQPATRGGSNTPSSMGAPTASGANNAAASTEEAAPPPARASAEPAPKKASARMPKASSSTAGPGAFEMQQANILGQNASAVPWLWSALGKGNPDAPVKLADMYLTGHGVEKSCDQGLVILRSAAARGNARASARLGTLYATGICVQQNRVQAYEWMGTASSRSQSLSSWAEAYRQSLLQQMTPEERARVR